MTTITPYRSMRGISSAMGKPVSGHNLSLTLQGLVRNSGIGSLASIGMGPSGGGGGHLNASSPAYPQPLTVSPVVEFTCTCAPGWTGPTCEISKYLIALVVHPPHHSLPCRAQSSQHPRPDWIPPIIPQIVTIFQLAKRHLLAFQIFANFRQKIHVKILKKNV